jgi:hypothetical protein
MHRHTRVTSLALAALVTLIGAGAAHGDEAAEPAVVPFAAADLFFEFNATDDDAGFQLFLDGDEWDRLKIFDPSGTKILDIFVLGPLGELGLTEMFFESGEPSPDEVFDLLPEGVYRIEAETLEGDRMIARQRVSHDFLEAPHFTPADGEVTDRNNTVIRWDGVSGAVAYEVIVENEDLGRLMSVRVPGHVREVRVPPTVLRRDTEFEAEVIAIGRDGNKSITEISFMVAP